MPERLDSRFIGSAASDASSWCIILALGTFACLDLANFGVTNSERVGYGLLAAIAAIAAIVVLRDARFTRDKWLLIGLWLFASTLYLIPAISSRHIYGQYIAGDFLALLLPALLLVSMMDSVRLTAAGKLNALAVCLLIASILAPFAGRSGFRFEPPPTFVVAIVWSGILLADSHAKRMLTLFAALGLGYLALESGQRTALIIWTGIAVYVLACTLITIRWRFAAIALVIAVGVTLIMTTPAMVTSELISGYRVAAAAQALEDDSLVARFQEARDVARTVSEEGQIASWIMGFGHGATYRTFESFLGRNVTSEGRVHHVHFGPLMILLRYGIAGLLVYLGIWYLLIRTLVRFAGNWRDHPSTLAFTLALAGYLLESLLFNVLVDPLFSFSLAGFVSCRIQERADPPAVTLRKSRAT